MLARDVGVGVVSVEGGLRLEEVIWSVLEVAFSVDDDVRTLELEGRNVLEIVGDDCVFEITGLGTKAPERKSR